MTRWPVRSLALLAGLGILLAASPALAQVQTLDTWRNVISATPFVNNNTGAPATIANQSVSAGSNRLLAVAVVMELSGPNTLTSLTASFGGVAMTSIATSGGISRQEHAALFLLVDSQIPGGPNTLSVAFNVSGGGGGTTVTGLHVHWGSYAGVDQAAPVNDSASANAAAASVAFGSQVDYLTDGQVVYAAGNGGTPANVTPPPPGPPAFTQRVATTSSNHSSFVADTNPLPAGGFYVAATNVAFGGTTSAWSAVAVAALRPAPSSADLSVTKTGPASAFRGDPITYVATFANAGPSSVTGATIADAFPAVLLSPAWTCVAAGGATCPAPGASGSITVDLPSGGSLTFTVTATISPTFTGNLVNTATITAPAGTTDPVPGNNSASVTTVVVAQTQVADVSVTKTGPAGPLAVGANATWTITVGNNGPATAQNVLLSDPLPAGTTWVSTTTSVGTCSGTATVSCSFGPLASGATATVTIVATINALGTKSNTATVSNPNGSDYDPNPANDLSTWLTTVSGAAACGTPGGPGPGGTLSGVVNTYYPATASVPPARRTRASPSARRGGPRRRSRAATCCSSSRCRTPPSTRRTPPTTVVATARAPAPSW